MNLNYTLATKHRLAHVCTNRRVPPSDLLVGGSLSCHHSPLPRCLRLPPAVDRPSLGFGPSLPPPSPTVIPRCLLVAPRGLPVAPSGLLRSSSGLWVGCGSSGLVFVTSRGLLVAPGGFFVTSDLPLVRFRGLVLGE